MYVCKYVSMLSMYVCMYVCMHACMYVCICLSVCLSIYLSVCLSVCSSIYLSVCLSLYIQLCLLTDSVLCDVHVLSCATLTRCHADTFYFLPENHHRETQLNITPSVCLSVPDSLFVLFSFCPIFCLYGHVYFSLSQSLCECLSLTVYLSFSHSTCFLSI